MADTRLPIIPLTAQERLKQKVETATPDVVDIREMLNIMNRQRHIVLAITGLVIALTLLVMFQIKPTYQSTAQIMINARQNHVVDVESVVQGLPADQETVRSEIEILRSHKLAETVINKLSLWQNPEFNAALRPASPVRAIVDFAESISTAMPADAAIKTEIEKQKTIEEFLKNLDVSVVRNSRVISVSFTSENAVLARNVTAAIAESYLTQQLEDKFEATQRATKWLNEHIADLRKKLSDSEQAVEAFRTRSGLVQGKEASISTEQLSELNTQLILARTQRAELESKLRQVESMRSGDLATTTEVLQSPLIQKLREQESELISKQGEMSERLGPRHPDMIRLQTQLAEVRQNIQVEVGRIINGVRNDVQVARSREGALSGSLAQLENRQGQLGTSDVKLRELERESESNRALYETFLNRFKQTSSQEDLQTSDARMISAANLPSEPVFPRPKIMIPMGIVIGFVLGIMIALMMEYLDRGFRSMGQIEQFTGLSPLGLIPELASVPGVAAQTAPQDFIVQKPMSVYAEAIRTVRTALLLTDNAEAPAKTILVTSSMPSEGKTSFTLSLARLSALSGQKIIVVDCDLRRPNVHRGLNLENKMGIVDLLLGTHQLAEVLQRDKRSKIDVITTGRNVPNPADLLASEHMRRLLTQLKNQYDLIIIDSPPALAVADARVLSQLADKTVFLTRWAETPRDVVLMAVKQLADSGANLAGILLTRVNLRKNARYGYADSGYYGRKYSQYYGDAT